MRRPGWSRWCANGCWTFRYWAAAGDHHWYRKHLHGYFQERLARSLDQLTAAELKGYLAAIQARGLAENTVHGAFQTIKAFANWAGPRRLPRRLGTALS